MTLMEVVGTIDRFDRGATIYAMYPWSASTSAIVARPRSDGGVPDAARTAGCRYFLEVFIALGVLRASADAQGGQASEAAKCARLIEYAEFVSSGKPPPPYLKWLNFPVDMTIYCRSCKKHFDIMITGAGPREYRCSECGETQSFDLDAFVRGAVEQGRKMRKPPLGGR